MSSKKPKKYSKLTEKKKEEMFAAFMEKQSNSYVARKCRVSTTTVRRHREWEKWDERREIALKAAEKKMITSAAEAIVKNLEIVRAIKSGVVKILATKLRDESYEPSIYELAKLIETEGNLLATSPEGMPGSTSVMIYLPDNKRNKKTDGSLRRKEGRR